MSEQFRVGQRVCRVSFAGGDVAVVVGVVTRIRKDGSMSTIDGKKIERSWSSSPADAIEFAYGTLFSLYRYKTGSGWAWHKNWNARRAVDTVCKLRRLECKVLRIRKKRGNHD